MSNQAAIDANLNNMNCVVTKNHFGYDVIHNICAGTQARVDWALGDWVGSIMQTTLILLLVIIFLVMVIGAFKIISEDF